MFLTIILCIVVLCCVFAAQNMLAEGKEYNLICPVIIAGIVFLVNYFSPRVDSLWLAVIFLLAMISLFMGLIYESHKEMSEWRELIPFAVLALLFTFAAKTAAAAIVETLLLSGTAATIIGIIPIVVAVVTVIIMIIDLFVYQNSDGDGLSDEAIKIAAAVVIIAAILLLFCSCIFGSAAAKDKAEAEVTNETTTAEVAEQLAEPVYHYYNDDVQVDGDDLNDFNFGPDPYAEGEDAGYYTGEFAERRSQDPSLLAATALALDAAVGTDYIGEILYEGYDKKLDVLQRANAASKILAENEDIFSSTEDAITDFLAKAESVELAKDNIKDQLYMNNAAIGGIPQIVVYQSDVTSDWCLVYTFKVKTSSVKIAFRIPCGFQWTNPTEKIQLKEKVKAKVSKKPAVVKHDGDKGNGDDPTPTPTPTPTKKTVKKDPVNQGDANVYGGKNKAANGTGEDRPVKPSKDSGKNAEPEKQKEKEQKKDSSAPPADPIPVRQDSHDAEDKNAGNNNGEFNMDF